MQMHQTIRTICLFLFLATILDAAEPFQITDQQIESAIAKSNKLKAERLKELQKDLVQAKNSVVPDGAGRVQAAKDKGESIKRLETEIKQLSKREYFKAYNFLGTKPTIGEIGCLKSLDDDSNFIVQRIMGPNKMTLLSKATFIGGGTSGGFNASAMSPTGGGRVEVQETIFVVIGVPTQGLADGKQVSFDGPFVVSGTQIIGGNTVLELSLIDQQPILEKIKKQK